MAAGPKNAGQTQGDGSEKTPEIVHPFIWPDSQDMVSQNEAANRMFRQNSERLQEAQEAKRESQSQDQPAQDPHELPFCSTRETRTGRKRAGASLSASVPCGEGSIA